VAHGCGTPGNCATAGSVTGQPICSCECERSHFVAGAGLYLLKPFFNSNPAFTFSHSHTTTHATTGVSTADSETTTQTQQFHSDLAAAPRIWIGWVGDDGLGFRASWWQFQQGSRVFTGNAPPDSGTSTIDPAIKLLDHSTNSVLTVGAGSTRGTDPLTGAIFSGQDAFAFESNIRLCVWDFDVTQQVTCGPWALLLGGGVRYLHLSENYNAFRQSNGTAVVVAPFFTTVFPQSTDALLSGHDFDGAGPTAVLEVRRPLGNRGLVLYGNVRGSALFGSSRQQITEVSQSSGVFTNTARVALSQMNGSATVMVPVSGSVTFNNSVGNSAANNQHFALLPVAECELGLEWAGSVSGLGTFARVGLVGQTYFGGGNASSQGGDLGFLGLSLMTGVDF
jgi:hypothetical protein